MKRALSHLTRHRIVDIIVLVLIGLLAASSWFGSGLPAGHDALSFISHDLKASLFDHGTTSDWSEQELGYPYYLRPQLVEWLLLILSVPFGWIVGAKILYLILFCLAGVSAYLYVIELTKSRAASLVAGFAYLFAPFHVIEVVFEGHWCIGAAYALTPLVFLAIEKVIQKPKAIRVGLAGLLLALLTLTHAQAMPILIGPFLALYVVFRILTSGTEHVKAIVIGCVGAFSIALLLTAFWWWPLLWEKQYLQTAYSLDSTLFSATVPRALTLRFDSCCAPLSAFSLSHGIPAYTVQLAPPLLALTGVVLNRRNKHVWFFSASAIVAILIALGHNSPVDVYGLLHEHLPLFDMTRTPSRFLLMTSFPYAVLAGLAAHSILRLINRRWLTIAMIVLIGSLLVGNAFRESRTAFSSYHLTSDQRTAIQCLSGQEPSRLLVIPQEQYVYLPETASYTINPLLYSWLHGKQNVCFGMTTSTKEFLGQLNKVAAESDRGTSIAGVSDFAGIRYVIVNKTNPLSSRYGLDESLVKIFESDTIDIYENLDPYPRVLVEILSSQEITAQTWTSLGGTQCQITVTPIQEHLGDDLAQWACDYAFDQRGFNWLYIGSPTSLPEDTTAVTVSYYLPTAVPDSEIELVLWESDGSRYESLPISDMSQGWHKAKVPLAFFELLSEDEDMRLDTNQVSKIGIGIKSERESTEYRESSMLIGQVWAQTGGITGAVFSQLESTKYVVDLDTTEPCRLVLTESYFPGWVAKFEDTVIPSEEDYQFANTWRIDKAGHYSIILEFTPSRQRSLGRALSLATLLVLVGLVAISRVRSR